jgi:pilus assembly protein CpaB
VSAFRRNLVPLICIAFVAASVATGIFYGLLGSRLREASADTLRQPIVVAARNLERGTVMTAQDVKLSTWGGAEPVKGGYAAVAQVAGKTVDIPMQQNEPITEIRLVSRDGSAGIGIASGMRAISVHASDSSGILALLRAGHKVDVQVVSGDRGDDAKVRTLLENVEVLSVQLPDQNGGRPASPTVTLLITPAAADRLAVADSAARVRLLLRNPLDESQDSRPSLTLARVFADGGTPRGAHDRTIERAASPTLASASIDLPGGSVPRHVQLLVRIAAAEHRAVEEMAAALQWPQPAKVLQAVALAPGLASEQIVRSLEESREIAVLSSTQLSTGNHRRVSMQAGASRSECGMRIQLLPSLARAGNLRVRVQAEITASRSTGVPARRIETEVELVDGQSFVVAGLSSPADWPVLARWLFALPAKKGGNRELLVIVTAHIPSLIHTAVLAKRP